MGDPEDKNDFAAFMDYCIKHVEDTAPRSELWAHIDQGALSDRVMDAQFYRPREGDTIRCHPLPRSHRERHLRHYPSEEPAAICCTGINCPACLAMPWRIAWPSVADFGDPEELVRRWEKGRRKRRTRARRRNSINRRGWA